MASLIGVDVGGTFTDITLLDPCTGAIKNHKVPSTPQDPSIAIMKGIEEMLDICGHQCGDVSYLAHGTTVATNALIERKGARTGLLTTKGFADLLEIGRQKRPSLYDVFVRMPEPLIPGDLRFEIDERLYSDGKCRRDVDEMDVSWQIDKLKEKEVQSIAICFLFSYLNSEHERRVLEQVRREYPGVYVSASHEVVPEFREYDRMSTTAINAYLGPVMQRYMENFRCSVKEHGIPVDPYIMQSNGGIISIGECVQNPVKTAMSGPAAGVIAATELSKSTGFKNMITFDMGGTSADFSLIENSTPTISIERTIEGFPSRIPMLDIGTCGAGGGSIAWIDEGGALKVGPQSAGAVPGPACYGLGGDLPTVTDANLVLGRLNPDNMLGGRMKLDVGAASRAIEDHICKPTGLSLMDAACGILRVVNATMTRAIRVISVGKGYDPREFTLVSFGGGGGNHCCALAQELNMPGIVIPPTPGTFCSLGLLATDVRSDYVRSKILPAEMQSLHEINHMFDEMLTEGKSFLDTENIDDVCRRYNHTVDMRFVGQNYELTIPICRDSLEADGLGDIVERFTQEHTRKYGYCDRHAPIEFVNYRITALGILQKPQIKKGEITHESKPFPISVRKVYFSQADNTGYLDTGIYSRDKLTPGDVISGPAIVEQMDSTLLILPGMGARVDEYGNIIVDTAIQGEE